MNNLRKVFVLVAGGFALLAILALIASATILADCDGNPAYVQLYIEVFWREFKVEMTDHVGDIFSSVKPFAAQVPGVFRKAPITVLNVLLGPVPCCPIPLLLLVGGAFTIRWLRKRKREEEPKKLSAVAKILIAAVLVLIVLTAAYLIMAAATPSIGEMATRAAIAADPHEKIDSWGDCVTILALIGPALCVLLAMSVLILPFVGAYLATKKTGEKAPSK